MSEVTLEKLNKQDLINWAIEKMQSYEKERKLYNFSAIILSILDVVCGIIAIFYAGMLVTSVVASIACGTIWCGRFIQLVKTERLAKSLRVLTSVSLTYIAVRKKRSEYMKNFVKNIKNNPMTIIFAFLGAAIMGFAAYKIAPIYLIELPAWSYIVIAIACALLTVVMVVLLGWDSAKPAILRTAKKHLDSENYDKVVALVGELEKAQDDAKQAELANAARQKEIEDAKAKVAEYEKAKQLLAEVDANKPVEPQNPETPAAQ